MAPPPSSSPAPAGALADGASHDLFARAAKVLPGGVNSPVRAMRSIGRDPLFVASASGVDLVDVDGNHYVDWVCSWGPLIHGHAHPAILEAIHGTAASGTTFGAPTGLEVELAEEIARRVPSVEMLRMTSSGTEAAMSAVRLARAATGREVVVKFAGAYHGHVDGLLADAGSGLATQGIPASAGVLESATRATVVIPWNDREAVTAALRDHDVAALLAEPYPANMGLVPPDPGFLEHLRAETTARGTLLVFDEVITGFRVAAGGAQEREGVVPDITVMGKILGGGLPAAAFGGSRALMERLAPLGDVYQAGTLSGNPLAVAAGLASLRMLDADAYRRIAATTERLASGLRAVAERSDRPLQVVHVDGLVTTFFSDRPVRDYDDARACDTAAYGAWCRALLARGIWAPPSQFEAWFVSLAHDDAHVDRTLEAAEAALGDLG